MKTTESNPQIGSSSLIGEPVNAAYTRAVSPMHRHNAFIEALPEALETKDAIEAMELLPWYDENIRGKSPATRMQEVTNVARCVIILPEHVLMQQKFRDMLVSGYISRNPLSAEWRRQQNAAYPKLKARMGKYKLRPILHSSSRGGSVIGHSGVGKSTLIDRILSLYPQVIRHTKYHGKALLKDQLVWLKVNCPHKGSARGLCTNFFYAVDRILGKNYVGKYLGNKRTTEELLPLMAMVAGEIGLGVLVVDEIQRLKADNDLLAFFEQLTDIIGIPVVYIGTYKAFSLFSKQVATARRAEGLGSIILDNLALDDCWDHLIEKIWGYQYTNVPTPLTPQLNLAMYQESLGVVDFAVKIYMLVQWEIIGSKDERITPALIKKVARENLNFVQPYLKAIREKDFDRLSKFDDFISKSVVEEHLKKAQHRVMLFGTIDTINNQRLAAKKDDAKIGDLPDDRVAVILANAGFDRAIAVECAQKACARFSTELDIKLATAEAFRLAAEADAKKQEGKIPAPLRLVKKSRKVSLSGDLREIIQKAPKNMPPYEALFAAGIIKPAEEFFTSEAAA